MLPLRSQSTFWLAVLGVGACLVEYTSAFASHSTARVQLPRQPARETLGRVQHGWLGPLHALPVDTEAIRLLSGAAGGGEGINLDLIQENVRSTALTLVGGFLALNLIFVLIAVYFLSIIYEDVTDNFVQKLQDDYPEQYEKAKKALLETDLISELITDPEERREVSENYENILLFAASMRGDFDAKEEVLQFAFNKKMNAMLGLEDEPGVDQ